MAFHGPRLQDLELFTSSKLCSQLVSFVTELAEAAKGLPLDPARRAAASPLVRRSEIRCENI